MITAKSVEKASRAIDGLTEGQLYRAFDRFAREQPLVQEYVVRMSGHHDRIHELVMHLSVIVFKAYEAEYAGKVLTLKREDFLAVHDQARAWIAKFVNPRPGDSLAEEEPFLLPYFVEKLEQPLEDGTQYTAREQHDVLLIIKILILALDRAATR